MQKHKLLVATTALILTACGQMEDLGELLMQGSGTSGLLPFQRSDGPRVASEGMELHGSIRSRTGSQHAMMGWALVLSGEGGRSVSVAEIDAAGLYTFRGVETPDDGMTLTLLTPDYIVAATLSAPSGIDKTIAQYFRPLRDTLPLLENHGPTIRFVSHEGIEFSRLLAADLNGDGTPDGAWLQNTSYVDTDADTVINARDVDIDGDGIANWIDPDDDGDAVLDVFDGDADGDLRNDTAPGSASTDSYFSEGASWLAVQHVRELEANGTVRSTLQFTVKLLDDVAPASVQIRGAPSLLNGALEDGGGLWNRQLHDDGLHGDWNKGDRVFSNRVLLPEGKAPRALEAIFFELVDVEGKTINLPYVFSTFGREPVTVEYLAPTLRTFLLKGNPFGTNQDFVWFLEAYDEAGINVWQSPSIPAAERQFAMPEDVPFDSIRVVASTLDKVPGYASERVLSAPVHIVYIDQNQVITPSSRP